LSSSSLSFLQVATLDHYIRREVAADAQQQRANRVLAGDSDENALRNEFGMNRFFPKGAAGNFNN
jgi:hypothetical protein